MGKRIGAVLLCALMCIVGTMALADDYGHAVIKGSSSTKVHLREEASTQSDSLGLFFDGTQVSCKSNPDREWVRVKIGRIEGYIMGKFLRTGSAADRVTPYTWTGYTTATNYARLRKGPSTEYQFICKVNPGDRMTIMGETHNHWYYVKVNGEMGFISRNLVRVSDSGGSSSGYKTEPPKATPIPSPGSGWQGAYIRHLQERVYDGIETYGLIDVNGDDVPELVMNSGAEAGGCEIVTYTGGKLSSMITNRLDFTYMPGGNLLGNCSGHMGSYFDNIYAIVYGEFVLVAQGYYYGIPDESWEDDRYDGVHPREYCTNYNWNGRDVSRDEYIFSLRQIYDERYAASPEFPFSRSEMINVLMQMQ